MPIQTAHAEVGKRHWPPVIITSSPLAVQLSWLENASAHPRFSGGEGLTSRVGQTDLILGL